MRLTLRAPLTTTERKEYKKKPLRKYCTLAAICTDGLVCQMTAEKDVNTRDCNVFFNELKNTLNRNKKYFL